MHLPDPGSRPTPGVLTVLFLLLRVSFRRTLNAIVSGVNREGRKKGPAGERSTEPRKATGRRKRSGWFFMVVVVGIFMLNGVQLSGGYLQRLTLQLGIETAPVTGRYYTDTRLYPQWLERDLEELRVLESQATPQAGSIKALESGAIRLFPRILAPLDPWLTPSERAAHLERMERRWRSSDREWLVVVDDFPVPAEGLFGFPGIGEPLARGVAWLILYLVICLIFIDLGMKNTDLGTVEGDLPWLYTFPVPASTLFAARLFQYTIGTVFGWFVFLPLLFTCAITTDSFGIALGRAFFGTLFLNLLVACFRFLGETWLRQTFSVHVLKNLQALFTIVGVIGLFAQLYMLNQGLPRTAIQWLIEGTHDPLWSPAGLPLLLALRQEGLAALAGGMALVSGVLVPATLWILSRLVSRGLLRQAGAYRGVRRAAAGSAARGVTGVLSKELRLLFRDRNLMAQAVILPILILVLQFSFIEDLLDVLTKVPSRLAAAAFTVGTYGLASSAVASLAVEQRALWLLFTFPVCFEKILLRKALFWGGVATMLTSGVVLLGLLHAGIPGPQGLLELAIAGIGILLFALIGTCLGALGTDPFEPELRLRLDPGKVKIFMYLMMSHAVILLLQTPAQKIAMTLLLSAFAYALLQDLRREIPYLLEPVDGPPPIITLSDGIYCVMGFFVSQQLISIFLVQAFEIEHIGLVVNTSFAVAGFLVYVLSRLSFRHRGITDVPAFWSPAAVGRSSLGTGVLHGLGAGILAIFYMIALMELEPTLWAETQKSAIGPGDPWFMALAILAAPVFEEYIFRGLVLRGFEASLSPRRALVGSALLFALVHPLTSFLPVLVLGLATGLAFQRTGSLAAAVLTHALYNALVVTVQAGLL